ncbi:MAG: alpha/beta fold hydrolase [Lautropia sp.]
MGSGEADSGETDAGRRGATIWIPPVPRLAAEVRGQGPLLVFLHGIGGNRSNWSANIPAFAAAYTTVALDVRGYGDSDDWDGPLHYPDLGHDVARVLDHFGADSAHIVGLSMGGRIAMQFARLHPERVRTLTFVDTHLSFALLPEDQRRAFVASRQAPLLAGKSPRDIAPAVVAGLAGPKATDAMRAQLIESVAALHKDSYLKFLHATIEQDTIGDLDFITAPAHFVVGEFDALTPPELTRRMAGQIRHSQVRVSVLPDAGHLSNIENPQAFNQAVRAFLDESGA